SASCSPARASPSNGYGPARCCRRPPWTTCSPVTPARWAGWCTPSSRPGRTTTTPWASTSWRARGAIGDGRAPGSRRRSARRPPARWSAASALGLRLAGHAAVGLRPRLQPALRNRPAAVHAAAVGALVEPLERAEHRRTLPVGVVEHGLHAVGRGELGARVGGRVLVGPVLEQRPDGAVQVTEHALQPPANGHVVH